MLNIDEVIIRFLDGSATQAERNFLLNWLKESEKNQHDFSQVRDLWLLGNAVPANDRETEAALKKLKNRILKGEKKAGAFSPVVYTFMKVAAMVVLLFGVGYFSYYWGERSTLSSPEVLNRLLTADGGKGRFVLPDSTVVWLNSNTILTYPENFTASAREVHLDGEAYFEVKRDEKKPFKVHADKMLVKVLGTKFVVKNYRKQSRVETTLVEGSVQVAGCEMVAPVTLMPGQSISYHKTNGDIDTQAVNTDNYTAWTHDCLTFDNSKLADVIVNMEHWYAIEIECDPLFARTISVSFSIQSGEKIDDILQALSLVTPIKYEWENGILHIFPKE